MTFITIFGLQNLNADAASLMEPSCNGPLEMEKFQTYRNLLNFVCLANYRAAWRVPEKTKRSWGRIIKFLDFPCIQNLNSGAFPLMEPSCNGPLEMEKFQTYRNRLMAGAKRLGPNVNVALLLGLLASSLLVRWFSCLRKWKKGLGGLAKGQKRAAPSSQWLFFGFFVQKNIWEKSQF